VSAIHTRTEDAAQRVAELLNGRTIATAESCTAGRVASALAAAEHANEFLRGGLVSYQEHVKRSLLGVTAESVLTLQCAREMAAGAARLFAADVTVSTTGVAGDEPVDGTPSGTVYIAVSVSGRLDAAEYRFSGEPTDICDQACAQALDDIIGALGAGGVLQSTPDSRKSG
jgi:nicotinamide-nucleotide amidase